MLLIVCMSYLLLPHGVVFENETKCLAVDIIDFWLMFEKLLNYMLYEKKSVIKITEWSCRTLSLVKSIACRIHADDPYAARGRVTK